MHTHTHTYISAHTVARTTREASFHEHGFSVLQSLSRFSPVFFLSLRVEIVERVKALKIRNCPSEDTRYKEAACFAMTLVLQLEDLEILAIVDLDL